MAQSLFTAAAGLKAQQLNIDTIANNIANVNTDGYRRSRIDFQEAIYSAMQNPALPADGQTGDLQLGSGSIAAARTLLMNAGPLVQTGTPLDLAVGSDGFFCVEGADGDTMYTRNGKFSNASVDGRNYLTTTDGRFVLDDQGRRISSLSSLEDIEAGESGRLTLDGAYVADLGIRSFANPSALEPVGSLLWRATEASGDPVPATTGSKVSQGVVEGSNVDIADEMTRLMTAQRAFAFLGRAITTSDAMSSVENEIRR